MGEESFFNALFHIMWKMETDIFSEEEKTLALLADLVPKCKKQRKRLEAMYEYSIMDLIESAVADSDNYELNLKRAVRTAVKEMNLSVEKAMFSVNQIIGLWGGDLPELLEYYEDELLDDEADDDTELGDSDDENENAEDGEENMMFLQDTVTEEPTEEKTEPEENTAEENSGEAPPEPEESGEPKESVVKKLVHFWCESDFEEGRPFMYTCPIGWVLMLLCCAPGFFMIYDIQFGDKFVIPTFAFIFAVLTSKRSYRFESTGRFSILICFFYIAAMVRALWLGVGSVSFGCVPIVLAALIVFNSGRVGSMFDGSKMKPFLSYFLIILFSGVITAGVYAAQNVNPGG